MCKSMIFTCPSPLSPGLPVGGHRDPPPSPPPPPLPPCRPPGRLPLESSIPAVSKLQSCGLLEFFPSPRLLVTSLELLELLRDEVSKNIPGSLTRRCKLTCRVSGQQLGHAVGSPFHRRPSSPSFLWMLTGQEPLCVSHAIVVRCRAPAFLCLCPQSVTLVGEGQVTEACAPAPGSSVGRSQPPSPLL